MTYPMHGTEYLARRLKEHRHRLGLASDYVAKALDLSVEDLDQYEYGGNP